MTYYRLKIDGKIDKLNVIENLKGKPIDDLSEWLSKGIWKQELLIGTSLIPLEPILSDIEYWAIVDTVNENTIGYEKLFDLKSFHEVKSYITIQQRMEQTNYPAGYLNLTQSNLALKNIYPGVDIYGDVYIVKTSIKPHSSIFDEFIYPLWEDDWSLDELKPKDAPIY